MPWAPGCASRAFSPTSASTVSRPITPIFSNLFPRRIAVSEQQEVNKLPYILTALGTLFLTMAILHFYGYLNFAREEGLLVADFGVVIPGSSEAAELQAR